VLALVKHTERVHDVYTVPAARHATVVLGYVDANPSCEGVLRAAYVRESNPQRWVVVGTYCDGCKAFWPEGRADGHRPGQHYD
jgi:deferrochelatase/peroxidase EfeB